MRYGRSRAGSIRHIALLAATSCALAGCGLHWPWKHRAPPPPQPVNEVTISGNSALPQYWDRNALLIDLSGVAGEGGAVIRPISGRGWPIRLELRVRPGSIARLEVQGAQRVVFEVPPQGDSEVLKLAPGAVVADTAQISLKWSAADDSPR